MKPYYQDKYATIYHGDCLELLPEMPKVDLVLTDPPYGMSYKSNHYKYGNPHDNIVGDNVFPVECIRNLINIANSAVLVFCRWDNLFELPKPKSFITWVKNNWSAGDLEHEYGRMTEGICFYPCGEHEFANGRPHDVINCDRIGSSNLHPTEKPVELCAKLLSHHKADTILDPFGGSCTTAVAAKQLNRKCIIIEIEEKYCEIGAKRLSQEVLDLCHP